MAGTEDTDEPKPGSGRRLVAIASALIVLLGGWLVVELTDDPGRTTPQAEPPPPTPSAEPSSAVMPTAEPSQSPMRKVTRLFAPEIVKGAASSRLIGAATSLDDPDVRISRWVAVCWACPKHPEARMPPQFTAHAVTTDGFRTMKYIRGALSEGLGFTYESPAKDLFLLNDYGNGREWLVHTDGSIRRVRRVGTPIEPRNPRHWFPCYSWTRSHLNTWCALDAVAATAYELPPRWAGGNRSVARPDSGDEPWGIDSAQGRDGLDAWWEVNGVRHRRALVTWPNQHGSVVWNPPKGGPMYWNWTRRSKTLDLQVGRDRGDAWKVVTMDAPPMTPWIQLTGTPDGGLLAWTTWPRLAIWRAEGLARGDFQPVYDSGPMNEDREVGGTDLKVFGDRIYVSAWGIALESADDGRTWVATTTWR